MSERLAFKQFMQAYAGIYWKDLPVLVTTDSLLDAIHRTYDMMLWWVESLPLSVAETSWDEIYWQSTENLSW